MISRRRMTNIPAPKAVREGNGVAGTNTVPRPTFQFIRGGMMNKQQVIQEGSTIPRGGAPALA